MNPHDLFAAEDGQASSTDGRPPPEPGSGAEWHLFRRVVRYGAALLLIDLLVLIRDLWAAQLLLVPLLLIVPGCLLLNALRVPGSSVTAFPLYIPAASLVVLMASSLIVDFAGPSLGFETPLRPAPLLISLQVICVVLLMVGATAPPNTAIPWPPLQPARWLALPALISITAAAGALRLNTGHGTALAVAGLLICLLVLVVAAVVADRVDGVRLSILLFTVSLGMMWAYSLRSDLVFGYDIATEYFVAQDTARSGLWQLSPHPDAYGAMVSITLLPAQLHALLGMPVEVVLKVVYPVVFAMFPVGIFNIAARFVPQRWAFIAAVYVLVQGNVSQQLPALARQEIALLLFLALTGAILEIGIARFPRVALVALFAAAMVVSHYSTAYFAVAMLGGALALQVVLSITHRTAPLRWTVVAAFTAATLSAFVWYVPLTQSASNVGQFRKALTSDGLQLLPRGSNGGNLISAYFRGPDVTSIPAADYVRQVRVQYAARKYVVPAVDADDARYAIRDHPIAAPPLRLPMVKRAFNLAVLVLQQLANVLALVGALMMALQRRSTGLARQVGLLAVPAIGCLMLFRLSATFASSYNAGRAQIQALTVLSIAMCWLLYQLAQKFGASLNGVTALNARKGRLISADTVGPRAERVLWALAGAAVLSISINSSGLSALALGGGAPANLSAGGEDVERFYFAAPEVASAHWLAENSRASRSTVYADRYGQLRLWSAMGTSRQILTDLTPQTLNRRTWIYASRTNVEEGRTRSLLNNSRLAIYAFPSTFINEHYHLVYTNGASQVYYR